MEPWSGSPRKRKRTSANAIPRPRRNSSSSSDILVAAPTPSSQPPPSAAGDQMVAMGRMKDQSLPVGSVTAYVDGGRDLVVAFNDGAAQQAFEGIIGNASSFGSTAARRTNDALADASISDDDGPNARGTYSKAYVARHPEISWVHRGQGRYLPATEAKGNAATPAVERVSRTRESRQSRGRADLAKMHTFTDDRPRTINEYGRTRGLHRDYRDSGLREKQRDDVDVPMGRAFGTRRSFQAQDVSPAQHVTRSGRKPKPEPEAESPEERRSSRFSARRTYNEQDSAGTDDDMADDKEQTYDRDYVNAHPHEQFYHTGNGWYKRGQRPKGGKGKKHRESTGQASARLSDGGFKFDANTTIHSTQLSLYPNIEFHHCGNGWYKLGPDATGHRNSTIIGASPSEARTSQDSEGADEGSAGRVPDTTVDRAYVKAHPEIEWVHRGNGRYKAKLSGLARDATSAPPAPDSPSEEPQLEPKADAKTYSRAYVEAHPEQEFHHRGNARYMKGPPPAHWAEARRQRRTSLITDGLAAAAAPASEMAPIKDGQLYDRAWVEAHPHEEYHHRGQGRYARGPRPARPSLPASTVEVQMEEDDDGEEEEESDTEPDDLVDTKYVHEHPDETFHHRGQGRWARGLPPIGASNKTAVRGPGQKDRLSASTSQAGEDEENRPPGIMDLVLKSEGPVRFPNLQWHYRGGGKWGRLSKQQAEETVRRQNRGKGKSRVRKHLDGAAAQLEREAAAADTAGYDVDDEDGFALQTHLSAKTRPLTSRRRRANNVTTRESFNMDEDALLSKQSSQKSMSQAPTPKPRIMTLEEDVLTDDDLPSLWRDEWSPPNEELDEADVLLRQRFRAMNGPEVFLKGMTKFDPNIRPTENLVAIAENTDLALQAMAAEYVKLDRLTAAHRRVPGKPAKGGTVPIDPLAWEDKKEADLYDYHHDPRKLGEQDPDAQRIQRDAEGRALRGRRNRSAFTNTNTVPGWNFGDDQPLGPRRTVKAPQRFDGVVAPPRKRMRNSTTATRGTSQAPSLTPERGFTPLAEPMTMPVVGAKGRLVGHVPKRVQELRGESVAAPNPGAGGGGMRSKEGSPVRKGRPPGSKNLHKRKDAGIKKGPRKPKVQDPLAVAGAGAGSAAVALGGDGPGGTAAGSAAEAAAGYERKGEEGWDEGGEESGGLL